MKRRALKALIAAALVVALLPTLNCKKEPDKISVRLKWTYAAGFAGDLVALRKGIFEKNGLEVEVHEGGFNLSPIKLVASGADDIGLAGADQVLLARAEGLPLVAIAILFQTTPVGFVARKDSGIETPQDFIGRKVAIRPGTDAMPIYEAMLKKQGIDRSKIDEIPAQYSMVPFLEGKVEVWPTYLIYEPAQLEKMGIEYNVIDPKDYGVDTYGTCFFTTEKMIKEHPDVVERYLKSVLEGYRWALENKDEATQIILSFSDKLDSAQERYMFGKMDPFVYGETEEQIGWMDREKWEATQQVYLDVGMLEKPVDLDSLYTTQFLEKIYK
ncbi:MAG: ABC transporter substrate-binding protein [Candidatus Stahlbacteria bacterium]|nr:MAG: ABC transporter substrate-binding protein [Candidatus Stahlbacteria bacterium]